MQILCLLGAANTDPTTFPDPDHIDLTRPNPQKHLAFGHGTHACLGAGAARAQARIAIDALLRLPNLHLTSPRRCPQGPSDLYAGPARLTVTWSRKRGAVT